MRAAAQALLAGWLCGCSPPIRIELPNPGVAKTLVVVGERESATVVHVIDAMNGSGTPREVFDDFEAGDGERATLTVLFYGEDPDGLELDPGPLFADPEGRRLPVFFEAQRLEVEGEEQSMWMVLPENQVGVAIRNFSFRSDRLNPGCLLFREVGRVETVLGNPAFAVEIDAETLLLAVRPSGLSTTDLMRIDADPGGRLSASPVDFPDPAPHFFAATRDEQGAVYLGDEVGRLWTVERSATSTLSFRALTAATATASCGALRFIAGSPKAYGELYALTRESEILRFDGNGRPVRIRELETCSNEEDRLYDRGGIVRLGPGDALVASPQHEGLVHIVGDEVGIEFAADLRQGASGIAHIPDLGTLVGFSMGYVARQPAQGETWELEQVSDIGTPISGFLPLLDSFQSPGYLWSSGNATAGQWTPRSRFCRPQAVFQQGVRIATEWRGGYFLVSDFQEQNEILGALVQVNSI